MRDQESKQKVPAMLQHALCLTIYEAKGLEFNDVILFNFFDESPCDEKWNLLKTLDVASFEVPKEEYEKNLSIHTAKQKKMEEEEEVDEKKGETLGEIMEHVEVPVDEKRYHRKHVRTDWCQNQSGEINRRRNTTRVDRLCCYGVWADRNG